MRHNRLSPRWVNRFIVLVLLLAPLVYLSLCAFAFLGSDIATNLDFNLLTSVPLGDDNFLYHFGLGVLLGDYPFVPWSTFLYFLDENIFGFGPEFNDIPFGITLYGYLSWCFYVLIADLAVYMSTFIVRIPFMITKWFERRSGND